VLISSHRKLLRSKAVVMSVAETPGREYRPEGEGLQFELRTSKDLC
jgi:hypothetical protein